MRVAVQTILSRGVALALACLLQVVGVGSAASAADEMAFKLYRLDLRPQGKLIDRIYATGPIVPWTAESLIAFIHDNGVGPGATLVLDSQTGDLAQGIRLGEAIRELGLNTDIGRLNPEPYLDLLPSFGQVGLVQGRTGIVPSGAMPVLEPGMCLAACALAYLGGVDRQVTPPDSVFGLLRPSVQRYEGDEQDWAQLNSPDLAMYISKMGVGWQVFVDMNSTGPDKIRVLGLGERLELKVENEDIAAEEASPRSGPRPEPRDEGWWPVFALSQLLGLALVVASGRFRKQPTESPRAILLARTGAFLVLVPLVLLWLEDNQSMALVVPQEAYAACLWTPFGIFFLVHAFRRWQASQNVTTNYVRLAATAAIGLFAVVHGVNQAWAFYGDVFEPRLTIQGRVEKFTRGQTSLSYHSVTTNASELWIGGRRYYATLDVSPAFEVGTFVDSGYLLAISRP